MAQIALQFVSRNPPFPRTRGAASTGSFLGVDAAQPCPFPHRKLFSVNTLGERADRKIVLYCWLFCQRIQLCFDSAKRGEDFDFCLHARTSRKNDSGAGYFALVMILIAEISGRSPPIA